MSAWVSLLLSFAAGVGVGLLFFGGLALTLKRLPRTPNPVPLAVVSLIGRLGIGVFVFYLLLHQGHLPSLLAGVAGFFSMQLLLLVRPHSGAPRERGPTEDDRR